MVKIAEAILATRMAHSLTSTTIRSFIMTESTSKHYLPSIIAEIRSVHHLEDSEVSSVRLGPLGALPKSFDEAPSDFEIYSQISVDNDIHFVPVDHVRAVLFSRPFPRKLTRQRTSRNASS